MQCLGIRCSNKDYSFVVLSGTKAIPKILYKECNASPRGCSIARRLKWFLQEIEEIIKKFSINEIVIKGAEPIARKGNPYRERIENEAMIFLAAEDKGIKQIVRKSKCTIAKDHGLKGRPKYLATLDCSVFPNFEKETPKIREAILAAWSCLK